MLWFTIPLFVVVLSALVLWSILYILFCRSPEKKWRDEVLQLGARAKARATQEEKDLSRLDSRRRAEEENVREEAFSSFLATISVKELEIYPGIGPATASKLESAGYSTLASLQHARIRIYGLGEKRQGDIYHAVHELTRQAGSRFDAGACHEAQSILPSLERIRSKYRQSERAGAARLKAAETVIESLKQSYALARKLTLISFWSREWDDLLPPEFMKRKLPDLDKTVERAEENALAVVQETVRQISAPRSSERNLAVNEERSGSIKKGDERRQHPVSSVQDWRNEPPPVRDQGRQQRVPVLQVVPAEKKTEPSRVHPEAPARKPNGAQKPAPLAVSLKTEIAPGPQHLHAAEQANNQIAKMELAIQFAFAVARSGAPLCASAKKTIQEYFGNLFSYDNALLNRMHAYCVHFEVAPIKLEDSLTRIEELFTVEERNSLVDLGERIVNASGAQSDKAVALLKKMAGDLKISFVLGKPPVTGPSTTKDAPRAPDIEKDECLRVLEIDAHRPISGELVRRHFNGLIEKFTPERVASLGSEFVETMERKREKVKMAATFLLAEFGEKLDMPCSPEPKGLRDNPDLDAVFGV